MSEARKHHSPLSGSYAQALMELAEERKLAPEAVAAELDAVRELVDHDEGIRLYFANPAVGVEERGQVIRRALGGKVSPLVLDFMLLLNQKGRLRLLTQIADAYGELLDQRLGKVEVDLIVAHKLTPAEVEEARRQLSVALKRDAVVHTYVDESIIGGAIIRVGDKLMDASVRSQLQAMKQRMLAARPK
jgi:F-type H+-transporting ATPase subunit delta